VKHQQTLTQLELLAPAKNLECGMAAVDHGADAVYIGAPRFGARASAGNSLDDIRRLCEYAHQFAVKVFVTVNTIIYDDELQATGQLIHQLDEAGVDAILVQDMGILQLDLPPIALHASTQTDNRTADKVRWLRDQGFRRAVLARELSVDEIAHIHAEVPDMPLEVFVHGALCVSYSGLCYASQHCFGRSANRGACAQFCRMKFDLLDADGRKLEHQRYLLSLKDLNQSAHLGELIEAGATSFKIEGRLKDVSYVKNVVAAYSQQLDAFISAHADRYCRASRGRVSYTFTPRLDKTFNRGFTTYFLHGRQPDIFSPDTPKAMGEYVGKVKELRRDSFNVAGTASFANGDGLCFINDERQLEGFRVNRAVGNRLFPQQMPARLRPGMALYRNTDAVFDKTLARQSAVRRIPVTMHIIAADDGLCLEAEVLGTDIKAVVRQSVDSQEARQPQEANIRQQLSRLGNTIYEASEVIVDSEVKGLFVPSSVLADIRRQAVEALDQSLSDLSDLSDSSDQSDFSDLSALSAQAAPPVPSVYARYSYLYNVANEVARQFYADHGMPNVGKAFEMGNTHPDKGRGEPLLMQCRHCVRRLLGYCTKERKKMPWREPLSLALPDGRHFRLEFDCRHCQMLVYAEN
jgi:putative protease